MVVATAAAAAAAATAVMVVMVVERGKAKGKEVPERCPIVSNEGPEHEAPAITDRFRRSPPPTSHLSAAQPSGHPPA